MRNRELEKEALNSLLHTPLVSASVTTVVSRMMMQLDEYEEQIARLSDTSGLTKEAVAEQLNKERAALIQATEQRLNALWQAKFQEYYTQCNTQLAEANRRCAEAIAEAQRANRRLYSDKDIAIVKAYALAGGTVKSSFTQEFGLSRQAIKLKLQSFDLYYPGNPEVVKAKAKEFLLRVGALDNNTRLLLESEGVFQ